MNRSSHKLSQSTVSLSLSLTKLSVDVCASSVAGHFALSPHIPTQNICSHTEDLFIGSSIIKKAEILFFKEN